MKFVILAVREDVLSNHRTAVVVTHRQLSTSGTEVKEIVDQLRSNGFTVALHDTPEIPVFSSSNGPAIDPDTEIVVVLGGDGTILHAAELVKGTNVPIVGINMGHVGFLAEFESFQIEDAIAKIAARDYSIDERVIASVDVWLPGANEPLRDWALNDVTLERADRGKMVELSISVDDVEMSSFGCDGVIVSTPTGSTAYAFSAGGPIIWPNVDALQLVPLAAHALFARPLIIGSRSTFTLDISQESGSEGWICCDGRRQRGIPRGSRVVVKQSPNSLRLARLVGVPFTSRLVSKFELPVMGWRESSKTRGQQENSQGSQNDSGVTHA